MKGKFIVLYGVNNLGKTTQAKKIVEKMNAGGQKAEYLKYPIYSIAPSGKIIDDYLRKRNGFNLSAREVQIIFALNRFQFESTLKKKLDEGINIIAEDYTGTGIAWGMAMGVGEKFLEEINSCLIKEDLSFFFYGQRFKSGVESGHRHEENESFMLKAEKTHLALADKYGWIKINANQNIEEIHNEVWRRMEINS